jgi:hypothetical protein
VVAKGGLLRSVHPAGSDLERLLLTTFRPETAAQGKFEFLSKRLLIFALLRLLAMKISQCGLISLWLAVRLFGNVRRETLQDEFADKIRNSTCADTCQTILDS